MGAVRELNVLGVRRHNRAGPEVFGGSGEQVLTVNARTGMPVKSVFPAEGNVPSDVQTFKVYRVTLAGIAAGKF